MIFHGFEHITNFGFEFVSVKSKLSLFDKTQPIPVQEGNFRFLFFATKYIQYKFSIKVHLEPSFQIPTMLFNFQLLYWYVLPSSALFEPWLT